MKKQPIVTAILALVFHIHAAQAEWKTESGSW